MKLIDLLDVVDYGQIMKVYIENNGVVESEVSGDQASLLGMLSGKVLNSDVSYVEAKTGEVLCVWLEDEKDENA